jgi:plasmid stabilization system protein ParE
VRKYRVEITPDAEADIRDIFEFISGRNPSAAKAWVGEVERQISTPIKTPAKASVRTLNNLFFR